MTPRHLNYSGLMRVDQRKILFLNEKHQLQQNESYTIQLITVKIKRNFYNVAVNRDTDTVLQIAANL